MEQLIQKQKKEYRVGAVDLVAPNVQNPDSEL
ncbi:hypothetical protein COLO4_10140 [Corchorus olitorius]|uniref:Uncharacterized protein n=1 Tax=Corchorus olitorius TaxID=93759 RepID=A0A1R3K9V1_9ROSI|nr:hypothetical protein COLO4_10140 [Corchorus olitorius]